MPNVEHDVPFVILQTNVTKPSKGVVYCAILCSQSQSPFLRPMAHRAAPISVSMALGHASANSVKATAGAGPLVAPRV